MNQHPQNAYNRQISNNALPDERLFVQPFVYRRPIYRRPFGYGYGGFGFPFLGGFLGGLAVGSLARPWGYGYPYGGYPYGGYGYY